MTDTPKMAATNKITADDYVNLIARLQGAERRKKEIILDYIDTKLPKILEMARETDGLSSCFPSLLIYTIEELIQEARKL